MIEWNWIGRLNKELSLAICILVNTAGDAAGVVERHDLEAGVHRHREVREILGILLLKKLPKRPHFQGRFPGSFFSKNCTNVHNLGDFSRDPCS